ncbi:MAG: hypothetical protein NVS9B15_20700 [Acidobacteriaceae bacterium]
MRSETTPQFWKLFAILPGSVQKSAVRSYQRFRRDPRHPSLQFKKIEGTKDVYSARISAGYRAVCTLRNEVVVWFWIGSHAEYDLLLKR